MGGLVEEVKVVRDIKVQLEFTTLQKIGCSPKQWGGVQINFVQTVAVTNGHHDKEDEMDMEEDGNREVIYQN